MPFYNFYKNITKYLAYRFTTHPNFIKELVPRAPQAIEEIFTDDDERLNRALLPEWLKEASIQLGKNDDGTFSVLNLRGLTSFAELSMIGSPLNTIKANVFPFYQNIFELHKNEDAYFKAPIAQYEGQEELILGVPFKKRSVLARTLKSIRPVSALEKTVESALAGSKYSLFGTKEKEAWFGFGRIGRSNPKPFGDVLLNMGFGIPKTKIDHEKQILSLEIEMMRAIQQNDRKVKVQSREFKFSNAEFRRKVEDQQFRERQKLINIYRAKNPSAITEKEAIGGR